MEAVKEGRLIIVRVPLEGGGRLVVSVNDAEAKELYDVLGGVVEPRLTHTSHANGRSSDRPFRVCRPDQSARARVVSCSRPSPTIDSAPSTAGEAWVSWMSER